MNGKAQTLSRGGLGGLCASLRRSGHRDKEQDVLGSETRVGGAFLRDQQSLQQPQLAQLSANVLADGA